MVAPVSAPATLLSALLRIYLINAEYLRTPGLGLMPVNLPGYSPDFNVDEAVWVCVRRRRATLCLGSMKAVQERVGKFLASRLAGTMRRDGVAGRSSCQGPRHSCKTPGAIPRPGKCTSHLGFGLVLQSLI